MCVYRQQTVDCGVPRGSILGPLLYIICTNQMPYLLKDAHNCQHLENEDDQQYLFGNNCPTCDTIICYTDNATVLLSDKLRTNNQVKLEEGLDLVETFLTSNKLSINRTKMTIAEIIIGQKRARIGGSLPELTEFETDGTTKLIRAEKSCKLLGARIQDNMTWAGEIILKQVRKPSTQKQVQYVLSPFLCDHYRTSQ